MENASHNILKLSGMVSSDPEFSHESHGTSFYSFKIEARRLSGTYDTINALINEKLLDECNFKNGDFITTNSELRSFNQKSDEGSKLIVSAFIKDVSRSESECFENELILTGTICKKPVYRKTPLGREICDIMLAINRRYRRSDYIPLIIWGRNARIADSYDTGDVITVTGRVQSREYIKVIDGEEFIKTAYEVSVSSIEAV
ncbi:MAG: single-stranded DNA-binding protein [Oscillospiraceae bacterium]|nr:single-stranded DNA-binding protein [Oscillospiraceae bacterium]MBQ6846670.1 single-stranded DNA-binding protein [Oscillospiraceae bacterium]